MLRGEPFDVDLVDDRVLPGDARRAIVAPGEGRIDDDRLRRSGGAVPPINGEIGIRVTDRVAKHRVAPADHPVDGLGVGIDQELARVEPVALGRRVGSVDSVAVTLPGSYLRLVDVPDLVGLLGQRYACRLVAFVPSIEQAQLDAGRVL
jgi:hypothetical protein